MATKRLNNIPAKGKRLGWVPLAQVKAVVLTAEMMKGKKVSHPAEQTETASYLIP